jgi:hypothetical protein
MSDNSILFCNKSTDILDVLTLSFDCVGVIDYNTISIFPILTLAKIKTSDVSKFTNYIAV